MGRGSVLAVTVGPGRLVFVMLAGAGLAYAWFAAPNLPVAVDPSRMHEVDTEYKLPPQRGE